MKNDKEKSKLTLDGHASADVSYAGEGDAKRKKAKRWTVIDTVIVFMVLLALGGIVLRGVVDWGKTREDVQPGTYYVSFAVEEIHPTVLSEISPFDPLYLYETGDLVGYVGVYDDGTMALHPVTPISAATGANTVAAEGCMVCLEGVYQNGGLLVQGMNTYLSPGRVLTLRTDRAMLTVEIIEIRTED